MKLSFPCFLFFFSFFLQVSIVVCASNSCELQSIPSGGLETVTGSGGGRCGELGLEDWETMLSETTVSPGQDQSLLRWILGNVDVSVEMKEETDEEGEDRRRRDAVSKTMQNLIGPNQTTQKPVSPSPTSSSSSSSSVASPATLTCSKQSLMEAASAISEGKTEAAAEILTLLTQVTNSRPNSEQRLLEFMASALKLQVNPVDNPAAEIDFDIGQGK